MGRVTVQWCGPAWLRRPLEAFDLNFYERAVRMGLHGPNYDDRVIEHLVRFDHLQTLTLSNTGLSQAGVARLQRALPECRIERWE